MNIKKLPLLVFFAMLFFDQFVFAGSYTVLTKNDTVPGALNKPEEEQFINNAINMYLREDISSLENPATQTDPAKPEPPKRIVTSLVAGTTNASGAMLPVFEKRKEDQKGSRYLLQNWANGLVIDHLDTIVNNPSYFFNYDKISGNLLLTQDQQNYIEIEKSEVKVFVLKQDRKAYIFEHVFAISKGDAFYQRLASGPKYSLYKKIKTKFVKANYQSTGMIETGNNYDEYVDEYAYYILNRSDNTVRQFELKKKSVKDAFESLTKDSDKYFDAHKHDDIDENFVKDLTDSLNK